MTPGRWPLLIVADGPAGFAGERSRGSGQTRGTGRADSRAGDVTRTTEACRGFDARAGGGATGAGSATIAGMGTASTGSAFTKAAGDEVTRTGSVAAVDPPP